MKIALFLGPGENSKIVYNFLKKFFDIDLIILEEKKPLKDVLQFRIKRLGLVPVVGQLIFQVYQLLLSKVTQKKLTLLKQELDFDTTDIPVDKIFFVKSINTAKCRELIQQKQPSAIVVNGTRIIGKKLIQACPIMFNIHTGITPDYRGVHGGYWALAKGEPTKCGVTVHRIDPGVDTGPIFYQALIAPTTADHFLTYPLLQYHKALPLLKKSLEEFENNQLQEMKMPGGTSHQYFHPTIWSYLWNRIP